MEKERKYYIPAFIYTTGEADECPKSELIEVNEDVYRAYYRPVWQARDHAKRHGGCSTADWKKCSGDCGTCSYRVPSRTFDSVEYLVEDHCTDDAFKLDDIADISQRVKHKVFGTGTVVNQASNMITVDFPAKTCKFQVPDCFTKGFLTPEDAGIIATMKAEEEAAKAAAEAAKRAAEEKKAAEDQAKLDALKEKAGVKTPSSIKTAKPIERVPGKSMVFLVFQGSTYEEERKGQFIWAPQYTKSGATCHHWDRLMDVREGDVIFHCSNGYIQAISRAVGPCKNCLRPVQNTSDVDWTQWEKEGRSVQCEYHPLVKP